MSGGVFTGALIFALGALFGVSAVCMGRRMR